MSRYVGQAISPIEHRKLILAEGRYLDDLRVPGAAHAAFVRSPHARARITAIDTVGVLGSGVLAVLTAADVEGRVAPIHAPIGAPQYWAPPRPLLPASEVRFAGEPVAVVVAQTAAAAVDAAERLRVDYAALEPVVDMERALDPRAPRVHGEVEGNVLFRGADTFGDVAGRFALAEVTLARRFRTERITGVPLEPRGCIAIPDPSEDALTIWAPSQAPHVMRTIVAECLKMPESKLRVRVPDIGGGFGIKIHVYPEEVPDIDVSHLDNPSPSTEGGFKGVGESGIIGAPAAIVNAIADAVPSAGPELTTLPVTPERLWRSLTRGTAPAPHAP